MTKKRTKFNARQQRRVHRRCDTCGRCECACEIRGDDPWRETPGRISRDEARELGLAL